MPQIDFPENCPICGVQMPTRKHRSNDFLIPYCGNCEEPETSELRTSQWYAIGYYIGDWTHRPVGTQHFLDALDLGILDRAGDLKDDDR